MAMTRRARRLTIAAVLLGALLAIAAFVLPSIAARRMALHYLRDAGFSARIGDVDANLFTGRIEFENAQGQTRQGDGFDIGTLALSLNYAPLLSQRLNLNHVELRESRVDIRRSADGRLRIAGIDLQALQSDNQKPSDWGFGVQRVAIDDLRLNYSQPATDAQEAFTRELVVKNLHSRNIQTWQPRDAIPIDATVINGEGRIALNGEFTPLARPLTGTFDLETRQFQLDTLAPVRRQLGLARLTGQLDSNLQTDFKYGADTGLTLVLAGKADGGTLEIASANHARLASPRLKWLGKIELSLLHTDDTPDTVAAAGQLQAESLAVGQADNFDLHGDQLEWIGTTRLTGATNTTRLAADGNLTSRGLNGNVSGSADFNTRQLAWQGQAAIDLGDAMHHHAQGRLEVGNTHVTTTNTPLEFGASRISFDGDYLFTPGAADQPDTATTSGQLHIDTLDIRRPGVVDLHQDKAEWQGRTTLTMGASDNRIATTGNLTAHGMGVGLADSARLESSRVDWHGDATVITGPQLSHRANGRIKTRHTHIAVPNAGLDIDATAIAFDGSTQLKPGSTSQPRTISSDGELQIDTLNANRPGTFDLQADNARWHGNTTLALAGGAGPLTTDGDLRADAVRFAVPDTARFRSRRLTWQGHAATAMTQQADTRANGRLGARGARLDLFDTPLAARADDIVFDGRYRQTADGMARGPLLHADIDAQDFELTNTAIDAAWAHARQAHADGFVLDGIDTIRFKRLTTTGLRLLDDTDTDTAVLQATQATARDFSLQNQQAYRLTALDIEGAGIHVRRGDAGMGVLSLFLANDDSGGKNTPAEESTHADHSPTFAVETIQLAGPSVHFTDTAVTPEVQAGASDLTLSLNGLDTAQPNRPAQYRLSADVGQYAHIDSFGKLALFAPDGADMNLVAYLRSLALPPLSGYLNAAMGRTMTRGVANGTLDLKATNGQLDGKLDVTLSNFRLGNGRKQNTEIVWGISMTTALALVRTGDDNIDFTTLILGDTTYPQFSINNLVREAVLAGTRTALTSTYSPLGLLEKLGDAFLDLFQDLSFRAVSFMPGRFYVPPEERDYLSRVVTEMQDKSAVTLTITGYAVPGETDPLSLFGGTIDDDGKRTKLERLALERARAVRDYIAARGIAATRLTIAEPVVDYRQNAKARATRSID